jgi:hypothetical protein
LTGRLNRKIDRRRKLEVDRKAVLENWQAATVAVDAKAELEGWLETRVEG